MKTPPTLIAVRSIAKNEPDGGEWMTLRVDPLWEVPRDRRIFGVMTRDLKWIR